MNSIAADRADDADGRRQCDDQGELCLGAAISLSGVDDARVLDVQAGRIDNAVGTGNCRACMFRSSESWEFHQAPRLWHSRAGEGTVHSIINGPQH